MKVKNRICDICKKELTRHGDLQIKYKAKRQWVSWHESGWDSIDICERCLNRIISAKERNDSK